jgi:hypothetical protein
MRTGRSVAGVLRLREVGCVGITSSSRSWFNCTLDFVWDCVGDLLMTTVKWFVVGGFTRSLWLRSCLASRYFEESLVAHMMLSTLAFV